jgi:3-oxo-5alpha-steroid 4-dehydrogenase
VSQGRSTIETDVLVVGFGAAGACAAIEAADEGAEVLIIDRFGGGGATALSGGVVYAGGGTRQQQQAGVEDTHEAMYKYLRRETDNVVSADTLGEFCRESPQMLRWLEEQGVPFDSSLCPYKTSYPNNDYYLYYSGSEQAFTEVATPAPRGHRTFGKGTSGRVFFDRLAEAVQRRGVEVLTQTTAQQLITDATGRVIGVKCRALRRGRLHRVLNRWSAKPFLYVPKVGRMMHKVVEWLERRRSAKTITIMARKGVILAAGGFVNNRHMMRQHAPAYRGGLPLGTPGDNGSGINMGAAVGGATAHMDRISVWRFLTPPSAMLDGLLVDRNGQRICDETRYGAAIGDAIIRNGGKAWLVIDDVLIEEAKEQMNEQTLWFQKLQVRYLLMTRKRGTPGIDAVALEATMKELDDVKPLYPPYSLIDMSIRPTIGFPAPMLTLGGLVVDEKTGGVKRKNGTVIPGLYAAGRNAVGICSNSYVSGLSLADCVFSGRRAGRNAAVVQL